MYAGLSNRTRPGPVPVRKMTLTLGPLPSELPSYESYSQLMPDPLSPAPCCLLPYPTTTRRVLVPQISRGAEKRTARGLTGPLRVVSAAMTAFLVPNAPESHETRSAPVPRTSRPRSSTPFTIHSRLSQRSMSNIGAPELRV